MNKQQGFDKNIITTFKGIINQDSKSIKKRSAAQKVCLS